MRCGNGLHEKPGAGYCLPCRRACQKRSKDKARAARAITMICPCGARFARFGTAKQCEPCRVKPRACKCGAILEFKKRLCPECKSEHLAANRRRKLQHDRDRYFANLEQSRKAARDRVHRHYWANVERCRAIGLESANRRRANKADAIGSHTKAEWEAIITAQGGKCAACYRKLPLERDHKVPLSRGGSDLALNIQGLCKSCNAAKRDKLTTIVVSLFDRVAV